MSLALVAFCFVAGALGAVVCMTIISWTGAVRATAVLELTVQRKCFCPNCGAQVAVPTLHVVPVCSGPVPRK